MAKLMAQADTARPTTLRVGAFDYRLTFTPDPLLEGSYGDIDQARQEIRVADNLAPGMERNTLWHEAIHGLFFNMGMREHDEQLIEVLAAGVVQIIRDNPWMAQTP